MAPGTRSKFGARSFGSKCTVLKKVLVTWLGLFAAPAVIWRPTVIRRPVNYALLSPPLVTPLTGKTTWFKTIGTEKRRTRVLHCGGRCENIFPKLAQRHCDWSSWMCLGEAFHLQHQGPKNHCWTEQNFLQPRCHPIRRPIIWRKMEPQHNQWQSLCLIANIAAHYILQPIVGVRSEAELFRKLIDDIVWITASEVSKEHIRQMLTSAFAYSGLELTFR